VDIALIENDPPPVVILQSGARLFFNATDLLANNAEQPENCFTPTM